MILAARFGALAALIVCNWLSAHCVFFFVYILAPAPLPWLNVVICVSSGVLGLNKLFLIIRRLVNGAYSYATATESRRQPVFTLHRPFILQNMHQLITVICNHSVIDHV